MKKTPLSELVSAKGKSAVAKALGVTVPAISKALSTERDIYVTEHDNGTYSAEELKPFPSQAKTLAA
jgi:predicted transcriptional regulator